MKTLKTQVNKIRYIIDDLQSIVCDLKEKQNAIEDKANERSREMTYREMDRYYKIETGVEDINECIGYLNSALSEITIYA